MSLACLFRKRLASGSGVLALFLLSSVAVFAQQQQARYPRANSAPPDSPNPQRSEVSELSRENDNHVAASVGEIKDALVGNTGLVV